MMQSVPIHVCLFEAQRHFCLLPPPPIQFFLAFAPSPSPFSDAIALLSSLAMFPRGALSWGASAPQTNMVCLIKSRIVFLWYPSGPAVTSFSGVNGGHRWSPSAASPMCRQRILHDPRPRCPGIAQVGKCFTHVFSSMNIEFSVIVFIASAFS